MCLKKKKDYGKEQRAKISDFISLGTETKFIVIKLTFQQISKLLQVHKDQLNK